jgi:hypothetical protein
MRAAKAIALLGTIVMLGGIMYAFIVGDFATEGSRIISMPWGIVSLIDLYTGFVLFSGWIIYREKSVISAILWVALMLTLGFFTGALYTFLALQKSGGDWNRFWHGSRAKASSNLAAPG